jgi:hypothetical protein
MGSESAVRSQLDVSKQGQGAARDAAGPVPGKATLVEPFAAASADSVARVAARAGEKLADGGGYTFLVLPDGAFKVVGAPAEHQSSIDAILTATKQTDAWLVLAKKLVAKPPAKGPQPAPTATATPPAPATPAAPAAPPGPGATDPSLVDRALATIESEVEAVRRRAGEMWSRALDLFGGGTDAASASAPKAPAPATTPKAPAAPGPVDPMKVPIDELSRMKAEKGTYYDPAGVTMNGTPLEIGRTRTEGKYGLAGTEYTRSGTTAATTEHIAQLKEKIAADKAAQVAIKKGATDVKGLLTDEERTAVAAEIAAAPDQKHKREVAFRKDLVGGKTDQNLFYCGGLSIWSLAAAGYKLEANIVGTDGEKYYAEVTLDEKGKPASKEDREGADKAKLKVKKVYATLKGLIDGEPESVQILALANGRETGGSVGELGDTSAYQMTASGELTLAARGAAGAFVMAKIGREVADTSIKPGDFGQSRYQKATDTDPELKYRGDGHAWQVNEVQVKGHALFGKDLPGAPRPVSGRLEGWHENVPFLIDDRTNPALVGKHVVTHASRLEANIDTAVDKINEGTDTDGHGGVQITGLRPIPDPNPNPKKYPGNIVFYGRLGTSPWYAWSEATAESAKAGTLAPAPAVEPAPAAAAAPDSEPAPAPAAAATPGVATRVGTHDEVFQ